MVADTPLIAEDTRLHVVEVVLTALLERRVVALLLELLRFQVVAGVVLVADGQRHDVQLTQVAAHSQHLQHRLLCTVIRVLGTSLTLGNPDILLLLADGIVNIAAHKQAGTQHLVGRQSTAHGESLVHTDQSFNPRIDEQVVADAYFHSGWIAAVDKHHVEKGRVEHNVAVVADEGVAGFMSPMSPICHKCLIVERTAVGMLADDVLYDGLHEPLLEVERSLHPRKGKPQQAIAQPLRQPRCQTLHYHIELTVVQQFVKRLLHLSRLVGSYLVELVHIRIGFPQSRSAHQSSTGQRHAPAGE